MKISTFLSRSWHHAARARKTNRRAILQTTISRQWVTAARELIITAMCARERAMLFFRLAARWDGVWRRVWLYESKHRRTDTRSFIASENVTSRLIYQLFDIYGEWESRVLAQENKIYTLLLMRERESKKMTLGSLDARDSQAQK